MPFDFCGLFLGSKLKQEWLRNRFRQLSAGLHSFLSGEHLVLHDTRNVGQAKIAPCITEGELLMVDAHQGQ